MDYLDKLSVVHNCPLLYCNKSDTYIKMIKHAPRHNGFWRVWNLAKKSGKILYKNMPIYKEKTWPKWSSVDPHCSLVSHSSKHRFKWKNWLLSMPFCLILSNLAEILIANCNIVNNTFKKYSKIMLHFTVFPREILYFAGRNRVETRDLPKLTKHR